MRALECISKSRQPRGACGLPLCSAGCLSEAIKFRKEVRCLVRNKVKQFAKHCCRPTPTDVLRVCMAWQCVISSGPDLLLLQLSCNYFNYYPRSTFFLFLLAGSSEQILKNFIPTNIQQKACPRTQYCSTYSTLSIVLLRRRSTI